MLKPIGNRCILRIDKRYLTEKGKPVIGPDGQPVFEQEQEATVIASNIPDLKKGMKVYPIIRGGVPIYKEETKKYSVVVIDFEDIYAYVPKV